MHVQNDLCAVGSCLGVDLQHSLTSAASRWWLLPSRAEFGYAALPGSLSGPSSNMAPSSSLLPEENLSS